MNSHPIPGIAARRPILLASIDFDTMLVTKSAKRCIGFSRDIDQNNHGAPLSGINSIFQEASLAYKGWMIPTLPDGLYPFIDQQIPLAQLAMIETPRDLEKLLREQAAATGTSIIRGVPVELRCRSPQYPDATFLIYWPLDDDRLHMLAPKEFAKGQA